MAAATKQARIGTPVQGRLAAASRTHTSMLRAKERMYFFRQSKWYTSSSCITRAQRCRHNCLTRQQRATTLDQALLLQGGSDVLLYPFQLPSGCLTSHLGMATACYAGHSYALLKCWLGLLATEVAGVLLCVRCHAGAETGHYEISCHWPLSAKHLERDESLRDESKADGARSPRAMPTSGLSGLDTHAQQPTTIYSVLIASHPTTNHLKPNLVNLICKHCLNFC